MTTRRVLASLAGALLCLPLAACGGSSGGTGQSGRTLTVLAASSLTDAFRDAGAAYEKEHPGTRVRFSFAGSQSLATQVRQGSPADVLVTANMPTMRSVAEDTRTPAVIARNRLTIVTAPGNPRHIHGLKDLTGPGLKVVLAAPEVPAGSYSREVLERQHLTVRPVSLESDVRSVLTKVELGEADAGIVYATDAHAGGGKVGAVPLPDEQNAVASYPAAVLEDSPHPEAARSFTHWLTTPAGFAHLERQGFDAP